MVLRPIVECRAALFLALVVAFPSLTSAFRGHSRPIPEKHANSLESTDGAVF